jgi:hypothetical protein
MDTEMVANDTIGGICVEHYDYYQPTEWVWEEEHN